MKTSRNSAFGSAWLLVVAAVLVYYWAAPHLPKKLFAEPTNSNALQLVDSTAIEALSEVDSVEETALPVQRITYSDSLYGLAFPDEEASHYKGWQNLIPFYEALYQLEKDSTRQVRIAYFGDSMTDGDMIVQDIRAAFQDQFGGRGVGYVSVTSESAASRASIHHEFSSDWIAYTMVKSKNIPYPLGINGQVSVHTDTVHRPWVKFKAGIGRHNKNLYRPTVFYGRPKKPASVQFIVGRDTQRVVLNGQNRLNHTRLGAHEYKSFTARFVNLDSVPVYGFTLDNGVGVQVDNFSQRGNSGIPLTKINAEVLQSFQSVLDYKLIVLQYGTNVLNYGTKDFNWYQKAMSKAIAHLQAAFPNTAILVISTGDRGQKYTEVYQTDSAVVPLTRAQRQLAIRSRTGFVDLFQLMGGEGTMVKWVETEPALGTKDYTHLTYQGSRKVASLLYAELKAGYEHYKKLRHASPKP